MLKEKGAVVSAYDPEAMPNFKNQIDSTIEYAEEMYAAINGADALAIVTEWSVFRSPDFDKMKSEMKSPVVFDGRNVYHVKDMVDMGFYYDSIGR